MKASAPNDYGTIPKATHDRSTDATLSGNSSSYHNPLEIQPHQQQEGGDTTAAAGGDDRAFQLPSPPPRQSPNQPPTQQQQRQLQAKPSSSSSSWSRWWLLVMGPKASAAHAAVAFLDSCVAGAIFPELPALAGSCNQGMI